MGVGDTGPDAGELGQFVDQERGVAGLERRQSAPGDDKGQGTLQGDHDRTEVLADAQPTPDRLAQHDHSPDSPGRRPGFTRLGEHPAQPGEVLLQVGVDPRLFHRALLALAGQDRPRQGLHVLRGQVAFMAQGPLVTGSPRAFGPIIRR